LQKTQNRKIELLPVFKAVRAFAGRFSRRGNDSVTGDDLIEQGVIEPLKVILPVSCRNSLSISAVAKRAAVRFSNENTDFSRRLTAA
jgi:hypothetical protein